MFFKEEIIEIDFEAGRSCLHKDSMLLPVLVAICIFLAVTAIIIYYSGGDPGHTAIPGVFAVFFLVGAHFSSYDCVIDSQRNQLKNFWSVFGIEFDTVLADFSDIHCVTVSSKFISSKQGDYYEYFAVAVKKDGSILQITQRRPEKFPVVSAIALKLAEHMGVPFLEGQKEQAVKAELLGSTLKVFFEESDERFFMGVVILGAILLVLAVMFAIDMGSN